MTFAQGLNLVACLGQLALAVASLARIKTSHLARPLGLVCACTATWTSAALAFEITGAPAWTLLDHTAAPLTIPLALDFALTFDGRRRTLRAPLVLAYALASALGSVSILAAVSPSVRPFVGSTAWVLCLLCIGIPTMLLALVSFAAHLQRSVDHLEEERARLVLAAFAAATTLGATEVLRPFAPHVRALGKLGLLVMTFATALVSLRIPWFESPARVRRTTYGLALGAAAVVVAIAFDLTNPTASRLVLGTVAVAVALVAASRQWAVDAALHKERAAQLATLGRFSAQMAHDLKNPLAALKGAAQVLRDDLAEPGSEAPPHGSSPAAMVHLMLEQIDRLARVIDTYGRLARIDVALAPVPVNDVVREVISLQSLAPKDGIRLGTELAGDLPDCLADRDMLASVIENLVRNAFEALPSGGLVTVRTMRSPGPDARGVVLVVEDSGVGMDHKTRERAFDDFFTTKPTGSGLGLAFVQRVVQAHGGEVSLTSDLGRGTVVRVRLPTP